MKMSFIETNSLIEPDAGDGLGVIPFADELDLDEAAITRAEGVCGSAVEEFGTLELPDLGGDVARRSFVDQDLGLDEARAQSRRGGYSCPCCGDRARRVMRVRVVTQPRWLAVCAVCAASMLARIPGTIVGGMVRPTRRRRPMRVQAAGVNGGRDGRYRRAG